MEEIIEIVLLVEDDKIDRMAFERFAKKNDFPYNYMIAKSVFEARSLLEEMKFSAVIMDYNLGDGTAFDLFGYIKHTPIIIVTGAGDQEIAVKAMKKGAYDYIIKDPEGNYLKMLPLTVENAINRWRNELELSQYRKNLEQVVALRTAELYREMEERKHAEESLIDLQKKMITISEKERQKIGQLLHDDLGQQLTGIKYMVTNLRHELEGDSCGDMKLVNEISEQVADAIERARGISKGMCPVLLENEGFLMAFEEMKMDIERVYGITCELKYDNGINIVQHDKAINIFYIARESVSNAIRHGDADKISINLKEVDSILTMTIVNDYGKNRKIGNDNAGIGIEIMRYRAEAIGGKLLISEEESRFAVCLKVDI